MHLLGVYGLGTSELLYIMPAIVSLIYGVRVLGKGGLNKTNTIIAIVIGGLASLLGYNLFNLAFELHTIGALIMISGLFSLTAGIYALTKHNDKTDDNNLS